MPDSSGAWLEPAALARALGAAGVGVFEWRPGSGAVRGDAGFAALLGAPGGEFAGTLDTWLGHVHPEDRAGLASGLSGAADGLERFAVEHRVATDEERWLEVRGEGHRRGREVVVVGVAFDASDRRAAAAGLGAAQRELLLLTRAGEALVATLRLEDVLRALGRQLVPEVADAAEVALVDDDGRIRRIVVTGEDMLSQERERLALTVHDAHPVAEAVRSGRMRLLDMERPEDVAAFGSPDQPGTAASLGLTRAIIVPLVTRERIVGALNLGLVATRPAWTPERLGVIAEIGRRAGAALENARLYEQQRHIATRLQQALLPDRIDAPEGLAVAARYAPGAAGMDVGGDWYDAVARADDVVVAVGDVVGHGLDSAALMGRLRTMFWTLLAEGQGPATAMRWVNRFLGERVEPTFVTTALMSVGRTVPELSLVSAGHLPPLLLPATGAARFVAERPDPPLGVVPDHAYRVVTAPLGPGDAAVLFTDGLVEQPGEAIDDGLERLRATAAAHRALDVDDLADALLAVAPGVARDDIALVVVRRQPLKAS